MKIIRLQLPGSFLQHVGFVKLFNEVESIEILNAFQYEQQHFFSLQRIHFKPNKVEDVIKYIKERFQPQTFQILDTRGDEVIIIMSQKKKSGFFPVIESGPWAFLFPIYASHNLILLNIISQAEYVHKLQKIISTFTEEVKIVGMTDVDKYNELSEPIWRSTIPFPQFTKRQREIASFAAKNGFFNAPKKITANEIAANFKISITAVNTNLRKAENLAMEYFFGKY